MKLAIISAIVVPVLVSAHSVHHHARQAVSSPSVSSSASAASSSASLVSSSGSGAVSGSSPVTTSVPSSTPSLTFTLLSTNPTAIPLSEITSGMPSYSVPPLSTTWAAGSVPSNIPGAPGLPNAHALVPSNYPPLDKTPPIDSAEVQAWIQEVQDSGVVIPDIPPTLPGGCPSNPQAVANTSNCWWTCGGCTASDDISTCPDVNSWGVTYDDGPSPDTPLLLQYLDQQKVHATFFSIGSRAISYPFTLQYEYMDGHQVAGHTWSHPYMTTLTTEEVIAELGWARKVHQDILGVTTLYWRPPYGDLDNRVRAIARAMNLKTVIWTRISATQTFDTGDYDVAGGTVSSFEVLNNWEAIMGNASKINTGFIVLEHDLFPQTVDLAVDYILPEALAHQPPFNMTPVVQCLKFPLSNSYLETNNNASNPPPLAGVTPSGSASASGSSSTGASGQASNGAQGLMAYAPGFVTAAVSALAGGAVLLI